MQKRILKHMYSKHLISAKNADKYIRSIKAEKSLTPYSLQSVDQDHFHGLDAVDVCIEQTNINNKSNVLDVGCGLGGPARYIAYKTKANVLGIEIQDDRFKVSNKILKKIEIRLNDKVSFRLGNFNEIHIQQKFTHIIAFLSLLHIEEKVKALKKMSSLLEKDGFLYIEDYYSNRYSLGKRKNEEKEKLQKINEEKEKLLKTISCPNLLSFDDFKNIFNQNEIEIVQITDMTETWKTLATQRYNNYVSGQDEKVFGKESMQKAIHFAHGVCDLFDENIISGIRIIGRKK